MYQPHDDLTTAIGTVMRAARVARSVQSDLDTVRKITKDDRSPVTVADFAVQAIVALDIRDRWHDALIVGEERAGALRDEEHALVRTAVVDAVRRVRPDVSSDDVLDAIDACDHDGAGDSYWTLDPVDGTKGFLRGQQYAIALARIDGGRVSIGVMGCPNLPREHAAPLDTADPTGVLYAAGAGRGVGVLPADGSTTTPVPLERLSDFGGGPVRLCESVEAAHSKHDDARRILESLGGVGAPARLDSQCKYAVVARGQADAYLRLPTSRAYVEKIWDHAAGMIVATESGAVVSDITGAPLDFTHGRRLETNRGVVCAASGLHEQIIESIAGLRIGAPAG